MSELRYKVYRDVRFPCIVQSESEALMHARKAFTQNDGREVVLIRERYHADDGDDDWRSEVVASVHDLTSPIKWIRP